MPRLQDFIKDSSSTDFVVGVDDFNNLSINPLSEGGDMYWFKNSSKGLVKRFILRQTEQIVKYVVVTLAKNSDGKFSPRFDFGIYDVTQKSLKEYKAGMIDHASVKTKAKVNLGDCAVEFNKLLAYLSVMIDIELDKITYKTIEEGYLFQLKESMKHASKKEVIDRVSEQYRGKITNDDINLLLNRKHTLGVFHKLRTDEEYFERARTSIGKNKRNEDVWQTFFEKNQWIFGYGLTLIPTEGISEQRLEQITTGANIFDGAGKRVDGLLRTKGYISSLVFCEIKTHTTKLLAKTPYREPDVYRPSNELVGGTSQLQKTTHKAMLKVTRQYEKVYAPDGSPTGINYSTVKPKQVLIIGDLSEFSVDDDINPEKLTTLELYRKANMDVEVITFDELYARAKYIVEGGY